MIVRPLIISLRRRCKCAAVIQQEKSESQEDGHPIKDSASHTEESCHSADEFELEGQEEYVNQQGVRFMPQQQQKEGE